MSVIPLSAKEAIASDAQFAAANGLAWLPHQQQAAAVNDEMNRLIDATVPYLPGSNEQRVEQILRHPDFKHGPNVQENLVRAHQAAQIVERQEALASIDAFANAKNQHGNPMFPHFHSVRPAMADIIQSGQATNLQDAYRIATGATIAKARRAAPVLGGQSERRRQGQGR